jgi:outer membrane protein assembly factor BamA
MKIHIDKRNNPLFTRNGFLLNGVLKSSGYFLGGERDYIKADISVQGYIPLGRRSVFAIRLKTGHIWDWNPDLLDYSFEKFYLGGSTSMRGWDVLRFKEISGDPWGDIFRFMTNVEYRFPIYRSIGMTVFSDGGVLSSTIATISMQDIQWDGGIGITVNTPLGPARLDYAVQFDPPRSGKIQLGVQSLF